MMLRKAFRTTALLIMMGLFPAAGAFGQTGEPAFKVIVLAPQVSHYTPGHDYAALFEDNLEKHWPGGQVELRYFPREATESPEVVSRTLVGLADDPKVRAVVIGEAPLGSIDGSARLRARRPDIFVIAIDPHEGLKPMSRIATLTMALNHQARGYIYPTLASRMGARSLVSFSFPSQIDLPIFAQQQRIMTQVTRDMGMILISDFNSPDPGDPYVTRAELETYLDNAVQRYLGQYGPNTAFVSTSTTHSDILVPIIMRRGGRMLPAVQSSLLLGFPEALDLMDEARTLFGQWRRLLALIDEKIIALNPPGQFAAWTYPYPHTAMLAMADTAVSAIEDQTDLYDLKTVTNVLEKYSPGVKWLVTTHMDYDTETLVPQVLLVIQDTYWFGRGYQGFTRLNIPARYYRIK